MAHRLGPQAVGCCGVCLFIKNFVCLLPSDNKQQQQTGNGERGLGSVLTLAIRLKLLPAAAI